MVYRLESDGYAGDATYRHFGQRNQMDYIQSDIIHKSVWLMQRNATNATNDIIISNIFSKVDLSLALLLSTWTLGLLRYDLRRWCQALYSLVVVVHKARVHHFLLS